MIGAELSVRNRMLKVRFGELLARVGGIEAAANFCRVGKSVLASYGSLVPADADRFAPADVIRDLEAVVGDAIVTTHLAVEAGGMFVAVPTVRAGGGDILQLLAQQARESSELTNALCVGLADGRLCSADARKAMIEAEQLARVAMQMRAELALIVGEG